MEWRTFPADAGLDRQDQQSARLSDFPALGEVHRGGRWPLYSHALCPRTGLRENLFHQVLGQ